MILSFFPYTLAQKLFAKFLMAFDNERLVEVNESHPANQEVLRYMRSRAEPRSKWAPDYYSFQYEMQSNVDVLSALREIGKLLPEYSFSVHYGYPALVYPKGGIIFAIGSGGDLLFLRLPSNVREATLANHETRAELFIPGRFGWPDSTIYASEFGKDWVLKAMLGGDEQRRVELVRIAYDYAATLARTDGQA